MYGIAAGGEQGALHAIKLLSSEIDRVLALLGCASIPELNKDYLWRPEPERMPSMAGKRADVSLARAV